MEKFISSASYVFPMVGFIIIIVAALMKVNMKPFLKYHVYQSIFIAFAIAIIAYGLTLILNILSFVPIVKNIIIFFTFLFSTKLILGYSIISFLYFLLILYLIIGVLRGSYSYIPWVSDIIKANVKG